MQTLLYVKLIRYTILFCMNFVLILLGGFKFEVQLL